MQNVESMAIEMVVFLPDISRWLISAGLILVQCFLPHEQRFFHLHGGLDLKGLWQLVGCLQH